MKNTVLFTVLLFVVCCYTSCKKHEPSEDGILCRYILIDGRLGHRYKNFLIEVTDSGLMKVSMGLLRDEFYDEILYEDSVMNGKLSEYSFFLEVDDTKQRQLTATELEQVKVCVAKTENLEPCNVFIEMGFKDAFEIVAIIGERKYAYVDVPYEELTTLLNVLLDLSPVDIRKDYDLPLEFTTVEEALKRGDFFHESYLNNVRKKTWWERTKEWFE